MGKKVIERLHKITEEKYSFIVLSVIKENKQAINLFKKFGYETFGEKRGYCYMVCPFGLKGKVISKVLVLVSNLLVIQ